MGSIFIPKTIDELERHHKKLMRKLREEIIPKIINSLKSKGSVDFIILYGSRARGDYNWASDFDLLICSSAFNQIDYINRTDLIPLSESFISIEIVCYTPLDTFMAFDKYNITILDALEDGIILYENGDLLKQLKRRFNKLKEQEIIKRQNIINKNLWKINYD